MEHIYHSTLELVGETPLLRLHGFEKKWGLNVCLLAKVEFFNPTSSIKDRAAKYMIQQAHEEGVLNKDTVIIEPTSGNTGIGLSSAAATLGYKAIFVMPETMSIERRKLIAAFGAEIVLTEGAKGMAGAIEKAEELYKKTPNSWMPLQFSNKNNVLGHYLTTGPEIWRDTNGKLDYFISGIGTGGTVMGTGKYLKEKKADIQIVGIEPEKSPVLTKGTKGPHKIQGIGAGFIPDILNPDFLDVVLDITDEDALHYSRSVAKTDGLLVGISSGASLAGAVQIASQELAHGKTIVIVLPDTGERYLSTVQYDTNE